MNKNKQKNPLYRGLTAAGVVALTAAVLLSCNQTDGTEKQSESEDLEMNQTQKSSPDALLRLIETAKANAFSEEAQAYAYLYEANRKEPYDEQRTNATQKAAHGYTLMNEQGYSGWNYVYAEGGIFEKMTWDDAAGAWIGGNAAMDGAYMAVSGDTVAVREFRNRANREAKIYSEITVGAGDYAEIRITVNGEQIFPAEGEYLRIDGGKNRYIETTAALKEGDVVHFMVRSADGAAVSFNPSIDFGLNKTGNLHLTAEDVGNEYKYFGDVHPYWYNGKMYMYYLDTSGNFVSALAISDNMLQYEDGHLNFSGNYALGIERVGDQFVSVWGSGDGFVGSGSQDLINWYNIQETDTDTGLQTFKALWDKSQFPAGGRDPFIFYDPDIDRYRITGMCYTTNDRTANKVDRSIVIYTSDDNTGSVYSTPPVEMIRFPEIDDGDPECTMMMKISERWYLFTSRQKSTGEVGGLSYWFGEPGQKIDDIDWANLPEHLLEGPHLKASQLTNADGKYYMYGWFPQHYFKLDWGGYLNLPHEVFAKEDGTLGSRFDPYLVELLNRGALYELNGTEHAQVTEGEFTVNADGSITSVTGAANMLKFDKTGHETSVYWEGNVTVPAGEGSGFAFTVNSGDKLYTIRVSRKDEGYFEFSIGCPDEVSRPYYAKTENIGDLEQFNLKVVIEDNLIEAVVNDTWALCANTSIKADAEATLGLAVWGKNITVQDMTVSKLADLSTAFD